MSNIVALKEIHNKIIDNNEFKNMSGPYIEITDFNHLYRYENIKDPSGRFTDKWQLFIQRPNAQNWNIINGMLTNNYSIVSTEQVLATIKKELSGDIRGEKHFINNDTMYCRFVLKGYELNYVEDEDINKLLFGLMTDINVNELNQEFVLSFNLINNLCGSHSLCLNYGFLCNLKAAESDTTLAINNMHILKEFETKLIHNNKLTVNYAEVDNIKNAIQNKINEFKQIKITENFIEEFSKNFPVKIVKQIFDIWEKVNEEYHNLYYFTLVTSAISTRQERIDFEVKCRNFISQYIEEQIKK